MEHHNNNREIENEHTKQIKKKKRNKLASRIKCAHTKGRLRKVNQLPLSFSLSVLVLNQFNFLVYSAEKSVVMNKVHELARGVT